MTGLGRITRDESVDLSRKKKSSPPEDVNADKSKASSCFGRSVTNLTVALKGVAVVACAAVAAYFLVKIMALAVTLIIFVGFILLAYKYQDKLGLRDLFSMLPFKGS